MASLSLKYHETFIWLDEATTFEYLQHCKWIPCNYQFLYFFFFLLRFDKGSLSIFFAKYSVFEKYIYYLKIYPKVIYYVAPNIHHFFITSFIWSSNKINCYDNLMWTNICGLFFSFPLFYFNFLAVDTLFGVSYSYCTHVIFMLYLLYHVIISNKLFVTVLYPYLYHVHVRVHINVS